jgi:hypothetical protein
MFNYIFKSSSYINFADSHQGVNLSSGIILPPPADKIIIERNKWLSPTRTILLFVKKRDCRAVGGNKKISVIILI